MKIKVICLLINLLFSSVVAFSQINHISWQQCFGTEEGDDAYSIIHNGENGYYIGIQISSGGQNITNYHNKTDAWIIKTDSIGNVIWERCYGGSEGDGVHKIIPIDNNTLYLFNHTFSEDGDVQNSRPRNFWIVKITETGNIIWENCYGNLSCYARDALLTLDGGLIMMGRIMYAGGDVSTYFGANDIWLCKIDSLGTIEWEKTLGNQGQDNAIKIKLTSDTTVLMIGGHYESGGMIECPDLGTYGADVWIVEIDMEGNILKQFCYGGSYNDLGFDIIEVNDGYVFAALTNSNDQDVSGFHGIPGDEHTNDIWVVKIDKYRNIIWQKCIGGTRLEHPTYITQTKDNGYIVIGYTGSNDGNVSGNHSIDPGYTDIWIVKLNSNGEVEWQHCYGGERTERLWGNHTVLKKSDYNFVLAAQSARATFDVECDLYGYSDIDAWILEIKDCTQYQPQTPNQASGPDTLCYTTDSTSMYEINTAEGAWGYQWKIEPEEAGTILQDSLLAHITWNQQYEGEVAVSAQSYNDCGESEWSVEKLTWVYNCVGINEIKNGSALLRVYPNPAKSSFEIRCSIFDIQESTIEIFDIFGIKVKEIKLPKGQTKAEVNVENWRKGLYLIKAGNGKNDYGVRKVIIQSSL